MPIVEVIFLFSITISVSYTIYYYYIRSYVGLRDIRWSQLKYYFHSPDPEMLKWLHERFPFYNALNRSYQKRLANRMKMFLIELEFSGDAIKVTTELKWLLTATYAQMTLGLDYPWLKKHNQVVFTEGSSAPLKEEIRINADELKQGFYYGQDGLNEGIKLMFYALQREGKYRADEKYEDLWSKTFYRLWVAATKEEIQRFNALGFGSRNGITIELREFQAITLVYFFEMPDKLLERHPSLFMATRKLMNWEPQLKRKLR